ncbi:MAG: sulfur-carrier protein adenylyltransferase/sulfurtransferase [Thermoleophilaceae bacterium]|jgi:bacteriocin biosynthesis cyclodehydratase domain-containing protein|nr:sulfur-carrier protein adenylyltransferase/sulfurtransferase [Thermoleophilaceae bacterium]
MQRPRLKTTTEVFESPAGDICLLRPSSDCDLVLEGASERDRELVALLDGTRARPLLDAEFGADTVGELLELLDGEGLVEDAGAYDALAESERGRYDRQLRYFADVAPEQLSAPDCQLRLRESRVVVLGVGGLGSWAAISLACCGVGELTLIDGDTVELSNLNRQILFSEADIGLPKAYVAAAAIRRFNPGIRVLPVVRTLDTPAEIAGAVRGSSFVVDAADRPAHDIERWVNSACFEHGVPYITMSHFPPFARVGPLYVPGETGCFNCQERAYRQSYELYDHLVEQRRGSPSPAATLGPVCAFVGGQVALDVVHQLTGLCEPASKGSVRVFDTRTLTVSDEAVPRDPLCEVCSD